MIGKNGSQQSVTILGSTGSVGMNTLDVIRRNPSRFKVAGLAAGSRSALLEKQIEEFRPRMIYLKDDAEAARLGKAHGVRAYGEHEGLEVFASTLSADVLVAASSGTSSLAAVLSEIKHGKRIALANKELLVMAGALVMEQLRRSSRARLVPVDSEHSAIFQCLQGESSRCVRKIVLTGSGGPLREVPAEKFESLPKEVATSHPKWKMGPKITVDSATLMNKGLEVIEAAWLFDIPVDRIEVLIHPETVIHSMVEFVDGSVLAQMGVADMRLPIQYALGYPDRIESPSTFSLDFATIASLSFSAPDRRKFPCLDLAYSAARQGGSAPCALSAADEVAVHAFLEDRIGFGDIPRVIESVLSRHRVVPKPGLAEIRAVHDWAAQEAEKLCKASKASSSSVSS